MKKLITKVLLPVLMAGLLTACVGTEPEFEQATVYDGEAVYSGLVNGQDVDADQDQDQDQPAEAWHGGPLRGIWDGDTYINEYLNMRFVMPMGWTVASDEEVADLAGFAADLFETYGQGLPDAFWDLAGVNTLIDMMAMDPFTGVNVQVAYERLVFPFRRATEIEFIQALTNNLESMGMRVRSIPGTTQIGDYTWHSIGTEMDVHGVTMAGRQFINIRDGFARVIILSFNAELNPVDMLLGRFTSLDIPPPPPPGHDEALVGVWAWDTDNSYAYIFEPDGHGMRGFYPDLDPFNWFTSDANHLILNFGFWHENWTYTIVGDVLTLDNRDVPGESFSYIRWEGDFIPAEFDDIDLTGHPLVGIWAWDGDPDWIYVFYADGTGTRGFPAQTGWFNWYAYDDQLLIGGGDLFENWTFTIVDDTLTLTKPGVTYSYVRTGAAPVPPPVTATA